MGLSARARYSRGQFAGQALVLPAVLLVLVGLVLPVGATLSATFGAPGGPLSAYDAFFASGFRRTVLLRTVSVALTVTTIAVVLGFCTAYVVSRAPGWLKSILIIAAVFPLLTGVVVRSFAWLVILGKNGILNDALMGLGLIEQPLSLLYTPGAVVVAMVYLFVPLMILTLVGVLDAIPDELIQASASLGASPMATFTQVILPLAVPGLIVGAVLVFTGSFTAYATPQLLGGEQVMMMGTLMYQQAMVTFDWVSASTIAAIMMVVTLGIVAVMNSAARRLNPMAS